MPGLYGKYSLKYPVRKAPGNEQGALIPQGSPGRRLFGRDAHNEKAKLGSGGRFRALVKKLRGKVRDPEAVAAAIGRKKFGKKRFQQLAAKGRRRK